MQTKRHYSHLQIDKPTDPENTSFISGQIHNPIILDQ